MSLKSEAREFQAAKAATVEEARQNAAFFLMCGIDLGEALAAAPSLQEKIVLRVERLIKRERLKGMRRHWSYDLNRHIALKQGLERLRAATSSPTEPTAACPKTRPWIVRRQANGVARR